jgi:hypothetical protein
MHTVLRLLGEQWRMAVMTMVMLVMVVTAVVVEVALSNAWIFLMSDKS